jgi:hypothetical protein
VRSEQQLRQLLSQFINSQQQEKHSNGAVWFVSSKHGPALQGGWGRGAVQVTFEDGSPITWDGDPIR